MLYIVFMVLVISFILYKAASSGAAENAGRALNVKFAEMGEIKGMSKQQIISHVGPPSSMEALGDGKCAVVWQVGNYRAVLGFEDDICAGILHESVN